MDNLDLHDNNSNDINDEILKEYDLHSVKAEYLNLEIFNVDFNDYRSPIVGELRVIVDRRDVEHDGYCSEPGDDVGEWKINILERYNLTNTGLQILQDNEFVANDKTVNLSVLKRLLDSDSLPCECGSNYCGYSGSRVVKKGWIVNKERSKRKR